MINSHMERYNILNTYKDDNYQKITLASEKENPENIVLLNVIKKEFLDDADSLDKFRNCIESLVFSEERENEIILATSYKKGFPISKYIQYYNPILKTRINFVYEYLDKITDYDCLDVKPANSLINESQVIIERNAVKFNDLLVIDDSFEKPGDFNDICLTVHEALTLFIFGELKIPTEKLKGLPNELKSFLCDLKENNRKYLSIKEIFRDFKNIYLYNLYLDDANSELLMKDVRDSVKSSDERPLPVYNPINAFGLVSNPSGKPLDETSSQNVPEKTVETFKDGDDDEAVPADETSYMDEVGEAGPILEDVGDDSSEDSIEKANPYSNGDNGENPEIEPIDETHNYPDENLEDSETASMHESDEYGNENEDDGFLSDSSFYNYEKDYEDLFNSNEAIDESPKKPKENEKGKKDRNVVAIILIAALLGIILTVCSKNNLLFFKDNLPVASFEHERLYDEWIFKLEDAEIDIQSYEWTVKQNGKDVLAASGPVFKFNETSLEEGEFTVYLKIKNDDENWERTYSDNYYNIVSDIDSINIDSNPEQIKEQFDSLSVEYPFEDSISKDDTVFRNGTYSLKIESRSSNSESKLTVSDLVMDNNSVISMWILSDSTNPFKVQLLGYKGKTLAFKRSVNFKPSSKNYWELLSVSQETNDVDRMEIVFSNMSSRIWIDDLDINSYK